jgi:hypothetical protein
MRTLGYPAVRCAWAAALAAVAMVSGCEICHEELTRNEHYQVQIIDTYGPGGAFAFSGKPHDDRPAPSCAGFDGVAPGAALELTTTGAASEDGCRSLSAEVTATPPGLQLESFSAWVDGIMSASQPGKVGVCTGTWQFVFFKTSSDSVFHTPRAPGAPSVVMRREYLLADGPCAPCEDYFVVSLSR